MNMLKEWVKMAKPEEAELNERLEKARAELSARQVQVKEKKLPVMVMLEGWGAAGKGSVLGKIIKNMDPRFFKVATMGKPTEEDLREPFLYRYFSKIPEEGKFMFFDGGLLEEVTNDFLHDNLHKAIA